MPRGNAKYKLDIVAFNRTKKAFSQVSRDLKNVSRSMTKIGKQMSLSLSLPIVGFGALAARTFLGYEDSMNAVQAVTNATGSDLELLKDRAKEMGRATQFSAKESADAMVFLAQAGLKNKQVYDALPDTLNLAAAGGLELAEAADIATNVMQGMRMKVKDLTHINDVMAKGASTANTDVRQLGEALKSAAPVASALGISLEDTTAILGQMANAGFKGGEAGNAFKTGLMRLQDVTPKMQEALDGLGISVDDFMTKTADGEEFALIPFLQALQEAGATAGDVTKIFGKMQGSRFLSLLNKEAMTSLDGLRGGLEDVQGESKRMAETRMQGLTGALKELRSAFEGLMIDLMEQGGLAQMLKGLANMLRDLSNWISGLPGPVKKMIVISALVAAAIGPILFLLGQLGLLLSGVASIASLFAGGGAAAAAGGIGAGIIGAIMAGLGVLAAHPIIVGSVLLGLIVALKVIIAKGMSLKDMLKGLWDGIKLVAAAITGYLIGAFEILKFVLEGIVGLVDKLTDGLAALVSNPIGAIKGLFGGGAAPQKIQQPNIVPFSLPEAQTMGNVSPTTVTLDFKNVPPGMKITQDKNTPFVDMNMGPIPSAGGLGGI